MKKQDTVWDMAAARERNFIGRRLGAARRERGLSLAELSRALSVCGVVIRDKGLSKWETGETVPNAYQLMAACRVLGLDGPFADYAPELNDVGQRKLAEYKADLIASGRYEPARESAVAWIEMPVCRLPVSAGTGMFLDGEEYETERFRRDRVPAGASFGVRVSGDSMEPVYRDGEIVWIQTCESLRPGEVGVFVYDGEGYIKVYGEREPDDPEAFTDSFGVVRRQPVLISYNQRYAPRVVSPDAAFSIVGRVLH